MKILVKISILGVAAFITTSCSSLDVGRLTSHLPVTFTTEKMMMTHVGMASEAVLELYGEPKSVRQSVCGSSEVGGTWTCTTWKYGDSAYDNASFTFRNGEKGLEINSFDIERVETSLPDNFNTKNIMKIKQGVTGNQIFKVFGPPHSISQSVCGGATGNPWLCTTWEYGKSFEANARFTFSLGNESYVLNSFDVERE